MEIKELFYFRSVVQHGSFSKAAAHIRIAQPALSRHVQKLETELGVNLLNRTTRGVIPTRAGYYLYSKTRELEDKVSEIRRDVSNMSSKFVGNLTVAVMEPLSTMMLPDIIERYHSTCPDVHLHIVEGYSGDLSEKLLERQLDIAIMDTPTHDHANIRVDPLWVEKIQFVGPNNASASRYFDSESIDLKELIALPMIAPSRVSVVRKIVEKSFLNQGLSFVPEIEADGQQMIYSMIRAGLGYSLMPRCGFHQHLESGELLAIDVAPKIRRTISIVTRTELVDDHLVGPFVELIKEAAPAIAALDSFGPASIYNQMV